MYTGTTITNAELKTLDPSEIKGWLLRPGGRSQEKVLKPGEKQAFTAVFFEVPNNLVEAQSGFQLVVVEGPEVAGKAALYYKVRQRNFSALSVRVIRPPHPRGTGIIQRRQAQTTHFK